MKRKKWLLFTLLVVVFIGIWTSGPVQNFWIQRALSSLEKKLKIPLQVQKAEGFFPFWLTLTQVRLDTVTMDSLTVQLRPLNLFFQWGDPLLIRIDHIAINPSATSRSPEKKTFQWPSLALPPLRAEVELNDFDIPSIPTFSVKGRVLLEAGLRSVKAYAEASVPLSLKTHLEASLVATRDHLFLQASVQEGVDGLFHTYVPCVHFPSYQANVLLSGTVDALLAFFDSDYEGNFQGSFFLRGETEGLKQHNLFPSALGSSFEIRSKIRGAPLKTLFWDELEIQSLPLQVHSSGGIENHQFIPTKVSGTALVDSLSHWLKIPLQGDIAFQGGFEGALDSPSIELSIQSKEFEVVHLPFTDLQGHGTIGHFPLFIGSVDFKGQLDDKPFTLQIPFQKEEGKLFMPQISLKTQEGSVQGNVMLENQTLVGALDYHFQNLRFLTYLFKTPIQGEVEGHLDLGMQSLSNFAYQKMKGSFHIDHFSQGALYLQSGEVSFDLESHGLHLNTFKGDCIVKGRGFQYQTLKMDTLSLNLYPNRGSIPYHLTCEGMLSLNSQGTYTPSQESYKVQCRSLSGQYDGVAFSIEEPFSFDSTLSEWTLSDVEGKIQGYPFKMKKTPQSLYLKTTHFPLKLLHLPYPNFPVGGFATLSIQLQDLQGDLQGEMEGSFEALLPYDAPLDTPTLSGTTDILFEGSTTSFVLNFKDAYAHPYFLQGQIPLSIQQQKLYFDSERSLKGRLQIDGPIPLLIQELIPSNHLVSGQIKSDLALEGSFDQSTLKGYFLVKEGTYDNLNSGLSFQHLDLKAEGEGNTLRITRFRAEDSYKGSLLGQGSFQVGPHFPLDLSLALHKVRLIDVDAVELTFKGNIAIQGDLQGLLIQGDIDVTQGEMQIPKSSVAQLPQLPITYRNPLKLKCDVPSYEKINLPLDFDLKVHILPPFHVDGRGLTSIWEGELSIKGTDADPLVYGTLNATDGHFSFAGKTFTLTTGRLSFDGNPENRTFILFTAQTKVKDVTIYADLSGPIKAPHLSFHSEPPLPQNNILSLVLFDSETQDLSPFQAIILAHTAATLSGVWEGPGVIDAIRKGAGLDQLSLSADKQSKVTIQVGKYITRDILVTGNYSYTDAHNYAITAHFPKGFQVQTKMGYNQISEILLQWKLSW